MKNGSITAGRRRSSVLLARFAISGAIALTAISTFGEAANAAAFDLLTPHRAVYDLTLENATERSGIANLTGRIVYELTGNACDGISVRYRLLTQVNARGETYITDQQTASFETPDGKEFDFVTRVFFNEVLNKTIKGSATAGPDVLEVRLDEPAVREIDLPRASFNSTHMAMLLEKADAGEHFFKLSIFDGGDDGDMVFKTTNVIGGEKMLKGLLYGEKPGVAAHLDGFISWPVTIAYFDQTGAEGSEATPFYEVSFQLYKGGISRNLVLGYPEYTLNGALVELEMLEEGDCVSD